MTLPHLALAGAAALLLAATTTLLLLRRSVPETFHLAFDTAAARAQQGWASFWSRDPFVAAQRERKGMAFGTYAVPGGGIVATHIAASDMHQHTLIVGSTGSGKSSLLETFARYHLRERTGFTLIDLHGDLFARVAAWALFEKVPGLVLLDFTKPDLLPGWNPLTRMEGCRRRPTGRSPRRRPKAALCGRRGGVVGVGRQSRGTHAVWPPRLHREQLHHEPRGPRAVLPHPAHPPPCA